MQTMGASLMQARVSLSPSPVDTTSKPAAQPTTSDDGLRSILSKEHLAQQLSSRRWAATLELYLANSSLLPEKLTGLWTQHQLDPCCRSICLLACPPALQWSSRLTVGLRSAVCVLQGNLGEAKQGLGKLDCLPIGWCKAYKACRPSWQAAVSMAATAPHTNPPIQYVQL